MRKIRHVLLSSPDVELYHYLQTYLPCLGPYEIEQASTLLEAVAKMNAYEPDLFICTPECLDATYQKFNSEILKEFPAEKILLLCRDQKNIEKVTGPLNCHVVAASDHFTLLSQKIKELLPDLSQETPLEYARLLIADDEPGILEVLNDLFAGLGLEVYTARDGLDALKVLKKHHCNLAILDLRMPHLDGDEVIEKILADKSCKKPKQIIIVTAALGSTLKKAARLGVPVISKPVEMLDVETRVLEACQKFHLTLKK